MTEREAEKLGFYYAGPSISKFPNSKDKEFWEGDKKIAREIKKKYNGADYVIVMGTANSWLSQGCKAIYGNDIFLKIYDEYKYNTVQKRLESYESRKQQLIYEFTSKLVELQEQNKKDKEKLDYINSLKKIVED